jgi:hypothetical protein
MTQSGTWAYLAVFALMALTFIGIPAVGPAVVGWAAAPALARSAGDGRDAASSRCNDRRGDRSG